MGMSRLALDLEKFARAVTPEWLFRGVTEQLVKEHDECVDNFI